MNNDICFIKGQKVKYPTKETLFRPSCAYAEYPFPNDIVSTDNYVYDMVREGLRMLGLDAEHFDTKEWNPLGTFIKTGDYVLLKPNMVLHENYSGEGTDCLYTHPSIVAAMIDYVFIALHGKGTIVVGDAPLQECNFDILINESGYKDLIEYYYNKGINIKLVDFRNTKTYCKDGLHYLQDNNTEKKYDNGLVVQLNHSSAFAELKKDNLKKLRITNYDPRILQKHHNEKCHEYMISKQVLKADVIINIPKPKTHRKGGVTISLKNLVGINANKEFLPHHAIGSKEEQGDAYLKKNFWLTLSNKALDWKNVWNKEGKNRIAKYADKLFWSSLNKGCVVAKEKFWEGSWYGNDTIWRTISDLNKILFYADKNGIMQEKMQRKVFIVGDMIVSGHKEGPLEPSPIYPGVIVLGTDPICFDRAVCSLMGFDYTKIPSLYRKEMYSDPYHFSDGGNVNIISNNSEWNSRELNEISQNASLRFEPTLGWEDVLGNPRKDKMINEIKGIDKSVYIFGAGQNGIRIAQVLKEHDIEICNFCDNNMKKWNKKVVDGIKCIKPALVDNTHPCIIAVKDCYIEEVRKNVVELGFKDVFVIN